MEQWNNVELSNLAKKSYTLNHEYDGAAKYKSSNKNNSNGVMTTPRDSEVLQPGSDITPKVNAEQVESLVRRLYGITLSEMKEFVSYDDRNFYIKADSNIKNPIIATPWPHGYVLKIANALDSKKTDTIEAQNQLMKFLAKTGIKCPRPIANVNGKYFSVENISDVDHVVRLLEFVPGEIFHQVETTNFLLFQSGEYLAHINRALKSFHHTAYDTHKTVWMLQSIPQLKDFVYILTDHARKAMVEEIIAAFESEVLSEMHRFETQIIHGDYNEQNILVEKAQDDYKISGIIDFGDAQYSPVIFEVGIAMVYMMLQAKSLERGGIFLAGYTSVHPIRQEEKKFLKYCIAARLIQSLVMGAYTHSLHPNNEYVLVTQEQGWKMIEQLWRESFTEIDELWQNAGDKYLTQSVK